MNADIAVREHLLQTMRDYLAQAENPQISVEDFCALAGVNAAAFQEHFADIHSLQLHLVYELVAFDMDVRDELSPLTSILDKVEQYYGLFWARYPKADFDQYERNLLKVGFLDYFQQSPAAAAVARVFYRQHWCDWLQRAIEEEGLATSISIEGVADFTGSFQNSIGIATAFAGASNRDAAFLVSGLQLRYFQRKTNLSSL